MPKLKTKSSAKKRFSVTGTGKLRKYSNYVSHFATNKSHKQLKHLHKPSLVHPTDVKRDRDLLQG
ncbi:MAG: 50S ribosomal protein L35 [Erysipelotrichaceae bacterium]|nr:50S ribosomal protein L35 [Erysipelotrichaceae bacterium]